MGQVPVRRLHTPTGMEVVRTSKPSLFTPDPYLAGYYVGTNPGSWVREGLTDWKARRRFAAGLTAASLDVHAR